MKLKTKKILTGATLLLSLLSSMNAANVSWTTDIASNTTWVSSNEYILDKTTGDGVIRVLPGATLTIQAGTIIRGQPKNGVNPAGSLAVLRGGAIIANGTSSNPIVFTTAALEPAVPTGLPDGFVRTGTPGASGASVEATRWTSVTSLAFWDSAPKATPKPPTVTGLWGGVIVLGKAPVNFANLADELNSPPLEIVQNGNPATPYEYTKPVVEGLTSPEYAYGSDWGPSETLPTGTTGSYVKRNYVDVDDNSGQLTYLSIRHGGAQLSVDNEINGLTLAGIGRGTLINHIEVWGNEDDGIEVFGGTVNMSHLAIFSTKDDGLDIDHGYSGQIQFALVVGGSYAEKLLEWDGDDADEGGANKGAKANFEPRGNWEARNVTLIGLPTQNPSSSAGDGANIRRNASSKLYNVVIANILSTRKPINAQTTFWNVIRNYTYNSGAGANTFSGATIESDGDGFATTAQLFGTINSASTSYSGDTAGLVYLAPSGLTPGLNPTPASAFGDVIIAEPIPVGNQTFFQSAAYRGAFDPITPNIWTTGWTAASASNAVN